MGVKVGVRVGAGLVCMSNYGCCRLYMVRVGRCRCGCLVDIWVVWLGVVVECGVWRYG